MRDQSSYSEQELLRQVAAGSEAAFTQLFNSYRPKLYTNIYCITKSRELAEDAVHDVFLKVWMNRETLAGITNFNAYLNRAVQNRAYTGFQRMAKEGLVLAELRRESSVDVIEPGEELMAKEVKAFIRQTIDQLTPKQKQVFLMSREEGLKLEEIAAG